MDWIFHIVLGIFLGWFFLPTPQWAKNLMAWVVARVPFLGSYLKK